MSMFETIQGDMDALCAALQCSPSELRAAIIEQKRYCNLLLVQRRRRSKKPRKVWSVGDPVRRLQRQVALWLREHTRKQGDHVTGFREHSSPLRNAQRHVSGEVVLTGDLADFFGTITLVDVMRLFEELGAKRPVSTTLARLCTIDERLMQGGRASAAIANLVAERLDKIILGRIGAQCTYTRYVDDITISGPEALVPSVDELVAMIEESDFRVRNDSIIRKQKKSGPFVTGLNVGFCCPRVPRRLHRQIERYLRFSERFDEDTAAQRTFRYGPLTDPSHAHRHIRGLANWVRPIDKELADSWDARLDALNAKGMLP